VPLVRILVLAIALAHASGVADLVLEVACEEACEEGDCEDCPPACPTCHCPTRCPVGVASEAVHVVAPEPRVTRPVLADRDRVPATPDPNEILRVPIARLA